MKRIFLFCFFYSFIFSAYGQSYRNDIKSCYDYAEILDIKPREYLRDIVVIVDQTVNLDENLKKNVHRQLQQLIKRGDRVRIVSFSANAQGHYSDIFFDGRFDQNISNDVRNSMNRIALKKFDGCFDIQGKKAIEIIHKQLKKSFHDSNQLYPKTELVGSFMSISKGIFSDINSERSILILVSDMVENSDVSSFYSKGKVKVIDAEYEFKKYSDSILKDVLNNADVYVIGAGYVEGGKEYSSQAAMNSLEAFWRKVINAAGGNLVAFGSPQLLIDIN